MSDGLKEVEWVSNVDKEFGSFTDKDDFLHLDGNHPDPSVTETYYFAFAVPEERIMCYTYIWVHPNLRVASGGVLIYQGLKPRTQLTSDYFNYINYMDIKVINPDTGEISLPNGFNIKIKKPMEEHELLLEDNRADTTFHVIARAAMPPVMRSNNRHFDQNMQVQGELRLRGKSYKVHCYSVRDRSWGEPRSEHHMPVPPYLWMTISGKDFALNVGSFDDMSGYGPHDGSIIVPEELFTDGWVYDKGKLQRIVSVKRRTVRTDTDQCPRIHELEVLDNEGKAYYIRGQARASGNFVGWSNMFWHQCLMNWDVNGRAYWGESQEVQWYDFIRQFWRLQN